MRYNKYTVVVDTNVLGRFKDGKLDVTNFAYFSISKETFLNLIKFLKDNTLIKNVNIAIPKIVFEELIRQQIEHYVNDLKNLRETFDRFKKLSDFALEVPEFDYETYLRGKIQAFIGKYKIIELDYPENACRRITNEYLYTVLLMSAKPFATAKGFRYLQKFI